MTFMINNGYEHMRNKKHENFFRIRELKMILLIESENGKFKPRATFRS